MTLPLGILFIACALFAAAGPITLEVRDSHGAPLTGATVEIHSGNAVWNATVASAGAAAFADAQPGDYFVTVHSAGVTARYKDAIHLAAEATVILQLSADGNLTIVPGGAAQTGTGGEQLSSKAVSELPLNKRDFSQLLLLAAGTMTDTNGSANFTQQFAVNGQRGTAAVFAMDGADSSDPEMGGATFTNFNVDAVQEIRSSSGWLPAEVGRGAAGFTDIITRSGSNAPHGSAFEFLRNADLDARNFFDRRSFANPGRIPPFVRNEFGFTNGGPLFLPHVYDGRNRTFYFFEYQGFRQVLGTTQVLSVPTAAERAGYDTTAFPGDTLIVPVDPRIATLIARYPLPNDVEGPYGARTYATSSKVATSSDQFSVRIDHRISSKAQLFGRFTLDDITGPTTNPNQTAIERDFAVEFINHERNAVISYRRTPSASFSWELAGSFTRTTPSFPAPNHTDPALTFGDNLYEPFNSAAGSVMGSFGNLFQLRHNLTWTRKNHTWKAGFEIRANRDTTVFGISPNGSYQFGGGTAYAPVAIHSLSGGHDIQPGDPLPDSLTGLLTASAFTYSVAVAPTIFSQGDHIGDSAIHRDAYNAYFQDTWKVSPNFSVDYGLRYEINSPIREQARRTSGLVLSGPGVPGSTFVINPQPGYELDKKGLAPRLALHWHAAAKTQLLAAAGITTSIPNVWQDNSLTGATPFVVYPRATAAPGQPVRFGTTITPQQLPAVYTPDGALIFGSGSSRNVKPNTLMDLSRFEADMAALSPDHQVTPLVVAGVAGNFQNGYISTWTAGVEQQLGGVSVSGAYVGTSGNKLPVFDFPNGFPGAEPGFAPYTQFDSAGRARRRIWGSHAHHQPVAFLLPLVPTLGAELALAFRTGIPGELLTVEIARRCQLSTECGYATGSFRHQRREGAVFLRHSSGGQFQSLSGSTRGPRARLALPWQDDHGWMATLGYRYGDDGAAVHCDLRHPADRCWLDRHRPARSGSDSGLLDHPDGAGGLLRPRRWQRFVLPHSYQCGRWDRTESGALRHARARHVSRAGVRESRYRAD